MIQPRLPYRDDTFDGDDAGEAVEVRPEVLAAERAKTMADGIWESANRRLILARSPKERKRRQGELASAALAALKAAAALQRAKAAP